MPNRTALKISRSKVWQGCNIYPRGPDAHSFWPPFSLVSCLFLYASLSY